MNIRMLLIVSVCICLCASLWMILSRVRLYGDDWFYYQFSNNGIDYYIQKNIEHYFKANGRVIVHVLVTAFLRMPMIVWRSVNVFFIMTTVLRLGKISMIWGKKKGDAFLYAILVMVLIVVSMDKSMTEQSVYWLTGSFNYVYPLWIFTWFMYRYMYVNKSNVDWTVILLGILAGASVEQAGMMSLGLVILVLMEKRLIKKVKITYKEILLLCMVFIGVGSVVLAPSLFLRAAIEEKETTSLIQLIFANLKSILNVYYFSRAMISVQIISLVGAGSILIQMIKKSRLSKLERGLLLAIVLALVLYVFLYLNKLKIISIDLVMYDEIMFWVITAYVAIILTGSLVYVSVFIYRINTSTLNTIPLISLTLGIGTLVMMLISPVFGFRNMIFAYYMFGLFGTSLLQYRIKHKEVILIVVLLCFSISYYQVGFMTIAVYALIKWFRSVQSDVYDSIGVKTLSIVVIATVSFLLLFSTYKGFSANAYIYDYNVSQIHGGVASGLESAITQKNYLIKVIDG